MRIVDRTTFLQLPAGTLYAKFGGEPTEPSAYIFGDLCIKDRTIINSDGRPIDWFEVQTVAWPEAAGDTGQWIDELDKALAGGETSPLDFDTVQRDGLFDDGQLFAVFSQEDHRRLIDRLQQAMQSAYGEAVEG